MVVVGRMGRRDAIIKDRTICSQDKMRPSHKKTTTQHKISFKRSPSQLMARQTEEKTQNNKTQTNRKQ